MIENFDKCLKMLLEHEGGFVNHPDDPGGMTNLGVTKAVLDKYRGTVSTEETMRKLSEAEVAPIYKKNYWDRAKCDTLPGGLDWSVFDFAVNSGVSRSAKTLQRIVGVDADGGIGPQTLQAVADCEAEELIGKFYTARMSFYENLNKPMFIKGWTRRNKETHEQSLSML